jgi:hypothetical protein
MLTGVPSGSGLLPTKMTTPFSTRPEYSMLLLSASPNHKSSAAGRCEGVTINRFLLPGCRGTWKLFRDGNWEKESGADRRRRRLPQQRPSGVDGGAATK